MAQNSDNSLCLISIIIPKQAISKKGGGQALSIKSDAFLKGGGYKAIAIAISAPIGLPILRRDIHNKEGFTGVDMVRGFAIIFLI